MVTSGLFWFLRRRNVPVAVAVNIPLNPNAKTRPGSGTPHYKALGGKLGHAYNRLVEKDPTTGQCRLRMHMSLHPFYVQERQRAGRRYAFRPEKQRLLDALCTGTGQLLRCR